MGWGDREWTDQERETALSMARLGHTYTEIGNRLGRSNGSTRAFFRRNRFSLNRTALAIRREQEKIGNQIPNFHIVRHRPEIVQRLMDERDARANEPRTPNMILLGDPLPSRSALARSSVDRTAGATDDEAQPVGA